MNFFDEQYTKEWRSLGFYYQFDAHRNQWVFTGSKAGLLNFCSLLDDYIQDPSHKALSEHEHYGPDSYLKVVTWHTPVLERSGIYGSLDDIRRFRQLLHKHLSTTDRTEIIIDEEDSFQNKCSLSLKIMDEGFDPSTLDKNINNSNKI